MTDITDLAQSLKAAAEKAGIEKWQVKRNGPGEYEVMVKGSLVKHSGWSTHRPIVDEVVDKKTADFIALANPANVKQLVEALEKAQQRIIQLESRTVTVKLASRRLPSDYVDGEFGNDDLAAIHNACRLECKVSIEKYLSAYGIVVKWEGE